MQITLRQSDIEKSLKDYIAGQGIRTEGKEVTITFTSSRKGSGITAEVSIEDGVNVPQAPRLVVAEEVKVASCDPEIPEAEEPKTEPEEEQAPAKTTSLFG